MLKGDIIHGYTILKDFTTAGGGLSKWTFATKGGKEYFLKEFLSPKYPTADAPGSEKSKLRKKEECEKFEQHHKALMKEVNEKCGTGGNLVFTIDFFRYETKYYKVTEKIDVASLSINEIATLPLHNRLLILKTIAHSLNVLHKAGIVHGDLKPDNILIKQTKTATYTTKLIDFDNSYFAGKPPLLTEELVGDMVFYSPELAKYIQENESVKAKDLTTQSDIFALGLIYSLYLTGDLPDFNREKYSYACIASNSGEVIQINAKALPNPLVVLINTMLDNDYKKRPTISEVFEKLKTIDVKEIIEEEKIAPIEGGLKGGLGVKTAIKSSLIIPTIKKEESKIPDEPKIDKKEDAPGFLKGKGLNIGKE